MSRSRLSSRFSSALAAGAVALVVLPPLSLLLAIGAEDVAAARAHGMMAALRLSLETGACAVALVTCTGTPLAYWISRREGRLATLVEAVADLPLFTPPAAAGVALLSLFGPGGLASGAGLAPSHAVAIVLAQSFVAMPFVVRPLVDAFRRADPELAYVARSLGASPARAFFSAILPQVRPTLLMAIAIAFCRAFGDLGATLLFAASLQPGATTLPLMIESTLAENAGAARVMALCLLGVSALSAVGLRLLGGRR